MVETEPGHNANIKGAHQSAHPHSLITVRPTYKCHTIIPSVWLASVAEEVDMSLTWSHLSGEYFHDVAH